jgi:hypothetical protein
MSSHFKARASPILSLQGELIKNNLYDVNDSEKIVKKIVGPSLRLYRKYEGP